MSSTLLWLQLASSSLQRKVRGAPRPRASEVVSIRSIAGLSSYRSGWAPVRWSCLPCLDVACAAVMLWVMSVQVPHGSTVTAEECRLAIGSLRERSCRVR